MSEPSTSQSPGKWAYLRAAGLVGVATAIGMIVFSEIGLADVAMLYLIAIVLASLAGRGPALVAASLAVAALDFCFVEPRFTFEVDNLRHLLTFAVMFAAGLSIASVTVRLRRQEIEARRREATTAALLAFTGDIGDATDVDDIAAATVRHVEEVLGVAAAAQLPDATGALVTVAGLPLSGDRTITLPLVVGDASVGVLVVQPRRDAALDAEERRVLDGFLRQAALAIGRLRLAAEARDAAVRIRTEELRSSLLSAVSHDLRTPLAVVTGAATSLRDDHGKLGAAARDELLDTIVDEARRLERVLANLLAITRVETGLQPAREWVPVEELVGAALTRLEGALGDRAVEVEVPEDLGVSVDPVLFEQALINLIDNAIKHGQPPIRVTARRDGDAIQLDVEDGGAGVPAGAERRVFDKFVRASAAPGVGLGLAVVRGLVEAHGGTITAEGARFRIVLPAAPAPAAPALEAAS